MGTLLHCCQTKKEACGAADDNAGAEVCTVPLAGSCSDAAAGEAAGAVLEEVTASPLGPSSVGSAAGAAASPLGTHRLKIGEEFHQRISPDSWCVTKKDLMDLRREVRKAIHDGRIYPTGSDAFDPADDCVGPSIYTITDQYIKPVTMEAGGMSWALMRHPDGLRCDVFITHSWQEGIFEFIDKVLVSWPRKAHHAWCCMLANPQNLDISAMIERPRESPFAKALESATYVLVVPNHKSSIYGRLWCAYEAFLAYENEKVIMSARRPIRKLARRSLLGVLACAALGAVLRGFYVGGRFDDNVWLLYTAFALPFVLAVGTHLMKKSFLRYIFACAGSAVAAYVALAWCQIWWLGEFWIYPDSLPPEHQLKVLSMVYMLFILYFMIAAVDMVQSAVSKCEAKELSHKYTGSILQAHCSQARDEQNIRAEIGARTREVNETIDGLIFTGMSTRHLRKAAEYGVYIKGAAHTEFASAIVALLWSGPFILAGTVASLCVVIVDLLLSVVLVYSWACDSLDKRAFSIACLHKVYTLLPAAGVLLLYLKFMEAISIEMMFHTAPMIGIWPKIFCVLLMKMNVDDVASCGWIGPHLAKFLVARGVKTSIKGIRSSIITSPATSQSGSEIGTCDIEQGDTCSHSAARTPGADVRLE